jgi:hypothetical protein
MGEEFEGRDLGESAFWGVELARSTFRDVNFTGSRMHGVWLVDVEIDGLVDRLVINGVDVTDHVNANDPWQPLRGMLRPDDRSGLLAATDALTAAWNDTIADARRLPDAERHESVDGEWSIVQTLRHLVFGIDKWFTLPVIGGAFHPAGLPNTGSLDFPWPGLDRAADLSFDEAVDAYTGRIAAVRSFVDEVDEAQLAVEVEVLENGSTNVLDCLHVVFEEGFEHLRYARRDLAVLAARHAPLRDSG